MAPRRRRPGVHLRGRVQPLTMEDVSRLVEKGVRGAVRDILRAGGHTVMSCEGHRGWNHWSVVIGNLSYVKGGKTHHQFGADDLVRMTAGRPWVLCAGGRLEMERIAGVLRLRHKLHACVPVIPANNYYGSGKYWRRAVPRARKWFVVVLERKERP